MINNAPQNQYVYWVTYHFESSTGSGFGGSRLFSPVLADSLTWVESAAAWLRQSEPKHFKVLIIGWQRLEGDEIWEK